MKLRLAPTCLTRACSESPLPLPIAVFTKSRTFRRESHLPLWIVPPVASRTFRRGSHFPPLVAPSSDDRTCRWKLSVVLALLGPASL